MNFRHLRSFVKVVEAGNMTRAAADLCLAQPALGMQMRQLEEDLGVVLLRRHSRGVEPTPAGHLLHERAQRILELVESTRREVMAAAPGATETIRVGMAPSLMQALGPQLAMHASACLPKVLLSLTEEMSHLLVDRLLRDELDIALAFGVPEHPAIQREPLCHEDLVLVTRPEGRSGHPVRLSEALEARLAIPEPRDVVRETVARAARDMGLEVKVAYEVRSIPVMRALVLRGEAATILPFASVAEDVAAGRLDARPVIEPVLRRTLCLAWSQRRLFTASGQALKVMLRQMLAQATGGEAHLVTAPG